MNGDCEYEFLNVCGDFCQINFDLLIVTVAFTGTVITLMLYCAIRAGGVVIKYEMRIGQHFTVFANKEY